MNVALISLNQIWEDIPANLARVRYFVEKARNQDCVLTIFPELTLTGFSLNKNNQWRDAQINIMSMLSNFSANFEIDIVFGVHHYAENEVLPCNTLAHAFPTGMAKPVYSKLHPFTLAGEKKVVRPGVNLGFIKTHNVVLGASICYDLRFPVLYSLMASDCDGAICIANWPENRLHHWRALLVSRAIENQMYMIGVNRTGEDGNGLVYKKSSMIVSPDGNIMTPIVSSEEMDIYEVDFNLTARARKNFPAQQDADFPRYVELMNKKVRDINAKRK